MNELSIGTPGWMRLDKTRAVMAALEAVGGAGCARFVGGCVRNTLTGHPVADIDIATVLEGLIVLFVAAPPLIRVVFRLREAQAGGFEAVAKGWNG